MTAKPIPVIGIFSGPGGLAEGFAGCRDKSQKSRYRVVLSVEKDLTINWPGGFWTELIMVEEKQALERGARKEQRLLNGVELQAAVVKAGAEFWDDVLKWGVAQRHLKPKEISAMRICSQLPNKIPTENQCKIVSEALARLQTEGFQGSLSIEQ